MGSPAEAAFDPDNNRCRPCPHVRDATTAYVAANPTRRVHYLLVPCNGSVVDDVGEKLDTRWPLVSGVLSIKLLQRSDDTTALHEALVRRNIIFG